MEIQVSSRQKIKKINSWAVKRFVKEIVAFLDVELEDLSLVFCDDSFLRPLNAQYFGRDVVTDVISFPMVEFEDMGFVSGELIISVERALAQSKEYKMPFANELVLYIIHGFLHLMGYEDSPESERLIMKTEEERVLDHIVNKTELLAEIFID